MPPKPNHPANENSAVQRARPPGMGWRIAIVVAVVSLATWAGWWSRPHAPPPPTTTPSAPRAEAPAAPGASLAARTRPHEPHYASFGESHPTAAVRHVADWAVDSGDPQGRSFVIVDKHDARVWVFDAAGAVIGQSPALLGAATGDDPVPGIGEKPLKEIREDEKTTPAGRFIAEPGVNAGGEDVVWVSYDLAVSMHRVRPLVKAERRLERLASPTPTDNRISFGCINLPPAFYEQVLAPTVRATGAVIYVLPETRSPQAQFGSYEVTERAFASLAGAGDSAVK